MELLGYLATLVVVTLFVGPLASVVAEELAFVPVGLARRFTGHGGMMFMSAWFGGVGAVAAGLATFRFVGVGAGWLMVVMLALAFLVNDVLKTKRVSLSEPSYDGSSESRTGGWVLRTLGHLAGILLAIPILTGIGVPGTSTHWTEAESHQLDRFTESIRHAVRISQLTREFENGASVDEERLRAMRSEVREALALAGTISDAFLDKLHPQLRRHYRNEFERGLQLRLAAYTAIVRGEPAVREQLEWQAALDRWGDWYAEHLDELRADLE